LHDGDDGVWRWGQALPSHEEAHIRGQSEHPEATCDDTGKYGKA
jgi:hypothetical protein